MYGIRSLCVQRFVCKFIPRSFRVFIAYFVVLRSELVHSTDDISIPVAVAEGEAHENMAHFVTPVEALEQSVIDDYTPPVESSIVPAHAVEVSVEGVVDYPSVIRSEKTGQNYPSPEAFARIE